MTAPLTENFETKDRIDLTFPFSIFHEQKNYILMVLDISGRCSSEVENHSIIQVFPS